MTEKTVEILAVARHGSGVIAHTTAGRVMLSDEALKKFGLAIAAPATSDGGNLSAYNLTKAEGAEQRATADGIRVVALMLRERLSLFAACSKLGVPYGTLTHHAATNHDLSGLFEAAKPHAR